MTPQLLPQFVGLVRHWRMEVFPAPDGDLLERSTEPAAGRMALDHPKTPTRQAPEMRESQQVKRTWPRVRLLVARRGFLKWHQAGLLRVKGEPELAEAFGKHFQHPSGILCTGKTHDKVVRVTDEKG